MLSNLVITFLPRNKHLSISWLQSPSAVILGSPKNKICHCFSTVCMSVPISKIIPPHSYPQASQIAGSGKNKQTNKSCLPMQESNEHPRLISFRMDWLDLLAVQGTLKSLLQHHSSKASVLQHSALFIVQLSHPCMTTGKTTALIRWTFVGKVMSVLFNMLSGHHHFMANRWGNSGNNDRLYIFRLQNHCRWCLQPGNEKTLAPWKKSYDQP